MTTEAPTVPIVDDSIEFVVAPFGTPLTSFWGESVPLSNPFDAETIQTATNPGWIDEYLAYHGEGSPAYRAAFDFEAGWGAKA